MEAIMADRRSFLKIAGLAGLSLLSACNKIPELEWAVGFGAGKSPELFNSELKEIDQRSVRLLKRLTYGPRPIDIQKVSEKGIDAFIEEQLYPQKIDDRKASLLTRRIETLNLKAPDIFDISAEEAIRD